MKRETKSEFHALCFETSCIRVTLHFDNFQMLTDRGRGWSNHSEESTDFHVVGLPGPQFFEHIEHNMRR